MTREQPAPVDLPLLPIGLYALDYSTVTGGSHSTFPGNEWRSALGPALRRLACVTGASSCEGCPQKHACAYAYLFDTPPPPDATKMRRYERAPHPFVLRESIGPRGPRLLLTLIGRGNAYLPLMVLALRQAALGSRGIAGRRLNLEQVSQAVVAAPAAWIAIDGPAGALAPSPPVPMVTSPACPQGAVVLRIHSPMRVKRDGHIVGADDFRFADFFGHLLRRISMLAYFHTSTPFEADFRALMDAARQASAKVTLTWIKQRRYSARQKQEMDFGGPVGTLTLNGDEISRFWPMLWLGQYLHAGAGATMGLGHYELTSLSEPVYSPAAD